MDESGALFTKEEYTELFNLSDDAKDVAVQAFGCGSSNIFSYSMFLIRITQCQNFNDNDPKIQPYLLHIAKHCKLLLKLQSDIKGGI
jgi:hypothetical protein